MPELNGFSHLALTVRDLGRSSKFYAELFGLQEVINTPDLFIGMEPKNMMMFGLRTHDGQSTDEFTHLNTGMDHVGFAVNDHAELEKWQARLDELGVKFTPIEKTQFGYHLNFRDPDNIPLEFFTMEQQQG